MSIITVTFSMLMAGHPVTVATLPQFLLSMRTACWSSALCAASASSVRRDV